MTDCYIDTSYSLLDCSYTHWNTAVYGFMGSYYYSVVCLTTGPKPLPKRFLYIVRSKASSFKWEYPLLSVRSSSIFFLLLPRLLVTSISPFIFPSITCFRRQFLRKMWPIQLAFRFRISRRIFLCSLTLSNTSSFLTWSIVWINALKWAKPACFQILSDFSLTNHDIINVFMCTKNWSIRLELRSSLNSNVQYMAAFEYCIYLRS